MSIYPKFRPDLEAFEDRESEGRNFTVLKDPVSQQFFRLTDYEYRFLKTLNGNLSPEHAAEHLKARGYYYAPEDAKQIVGRAARAGLLLGTTFGTAKFQRDLKNRIRQAKRSKRLSSVYFLFIPLFNPDRFLEKTVRFFALICNRWTALLVMLMVPGALYLIISGIPRIEREFLFFFNLSNLLYLWITIALTKLTHEFAHAYTAKRFGLHVPQMGIAFLIFFPCLYCNTTDAWQLAHRKQRMAISGAGIMAEAVIATVSTYVWYFSQPGILNSIAFYLMGVALVSTIFLNGNPLLKFDGYFLLTDYLRMPNLYQKSFAHIKYLFMNGILGVSSFTRVATTPRESFIFTAYGVASFAYRVILYTGIVAGVYYRFDKTVGALLALAAFGLFIVRPVSRGLASLFEHRQRMSPGLAGSSVLVAIAIVVTALLFVPIPRNSVYPCYLDSSKKQKLTVPLQTWVQEVYVQQGKHVTEGTVLFTLDTSFLELTLSKKERSRDIIRNEIDLLLLDEKLRAEAPGKEIELYQAIDEIEEIKNRLELARVGSRAPFDGVVTWLDSRMKEGFQPGEGTVVGEIESVTECTVHALIPEDGLENVKRGRAVRVWFPIDGGRQFDKRILDVRLFSERDLNESPFSSCVGGELATEMKSSDQKDVPLQAQYDCSVEFQNKDLKVPLGMTGRLVVGSRPKSVAAMVIDSLARTFNRESLL